MTALDPGWFIQSNIIKLIGLQISSEVVTALDPGWFIQSKIIKLIGRQISSEVVTALVYSTANVNTFHFRTL